MRQGADSYKIRITDALRRLIFKVCEECICLQMRERNPLNCCRGEIALPRKTINIVDMSNHYA